MALGAFMIIKTEILLRSFGRIAFFDAHLGTAGGSRLGYKLIGFLFFFIGLLMFTGMIGGFVRWMLSPLMKYSLLA